MGSKAIILMGIKHCGKSTQARLLSEYFDVDFYDTDDLITELTGMSPREIYTKKGKEVFLQEEENACIELQKRLKPSYKSKKEYSAVIATGGGICNNKRAVDILRKLGTLVFLNADKNTAFERIEREIRITPDNRLENLPAYIANKNPQSIQEARNVFFDFYHERQKIYREICDISVNMKSAGKIFNRNLIINALNPR